MSRNAGLRKRAFTPVELLVVVSIIAVLAAIARKFTNASLRSKESFLKGELKLLRDAIANYQTDTTGYPAQITDLMATTSPVNCYNATSQSLMSIAANSWHGPYIANVGNDPISNTAFIYTYTTGTVQASSSDPEPSTDGSNYQNW